MFQNKGLFFVFFFFFLRFLLSLMFHTPRCLIFFNRFMYHLPYFPLNQCLSYFTLVFTGVSSFLPGYLSGPCLSLPIPQSVVSAFISVFPSLSLRAIHGPHQPCLSTCGLHHHGGRTLQTLPRRHET